MATFEEWYNAVQKSLDNDDGVTKEEKNRVIQAMQGAEPFIKAISSKADELGLSPEENYVLGYLLKENEAKGNFTENSAYDLTLIQLVSMMFVHEHKREILEFNDDAKRAAFVHSLTESDLAAIKCEPTEGVKAFIASESPTLDDVLGILGFGNAIYLYGKKNPEPPKKNRTKTKAGDIMDKLPATLATPTLTGYQNATSLYQNGNAYLQPLSSTDGLIFKNGKIYFEATGFEKVRQVSEVELQNIKTKEGIQTIDLPLLRTFYSIILTAFEATGCKEVKDVITLYVPDLAEYLGTHRNLNKQEVANIIAKTQSFHNIIGVLKFERNGKPAQSLYPVLNFEGYKEEKNTISFSSPYMNMVIREVYDIAVRKDKKGAPKLKKNGDPLRIASHSYLVKSEISKERNKAAVENVFIICTLIEQAGNNIPRIKASTIIERNPQLAQRLDDVKNKRDLLKTTFTKTWELLQTKTRLEEVYENIQLPDPKNPATIPTVKNIDELVFSFPHDGKKKA